MGQYLLESELATEREELGRALVIDAEGALIRSNLFIETALHELAHHPIHSLNRFLSRWAGKARPVARSAKDRPLDLRSLPLNASLIEYLRAEKVRGRRLYLVSRLDRRAVDDLAAYIGCFDGVFASDARSGIVQGAHTAALCDAIGSSGFDYIAGSIPDPEIRQKAQSFTFSSDMQTQARDSKTVTRYLQALRPHQWLKNVLVFAPAIAAHQLAIPALLPAAVAFVCFSMCASSAYLLNDLLDLQDDRDHPSKRHRPFASGAVPLLHGIVLIPMLLLAALAVSAFVSAEFLAVVAGYFCLTLCYSLWLKRRMTVDILTLACLYGARVVAGAVAVAVALSPWFLGFSTFLFLSLALVKRSTELHNRIESGKTDPAGRGYLLRDLPVLEAMAVASGYVSVMVFALYISSPATVGLYRHPERLWLICLVLLYWLSRVFVLTHRGQMHDDPVVFAATDPVSLISAAVIACVGLLSL